MIRPDKAWPEMPPAAGPSARCLSGASQPNPNPELDTSYVAPPTAGATCSRQRRATAPGSPMVPGTGLFPPRAARSRAPTRIRPASRPASGRASRRTRRWRSRMAPFLPFGTPGGDVQTQAMLQVLVNLEVFGMNVAAGN